MVSELRDDNTRLTGFLRETHELCATHNDVASTSLIETWIDPDGAANLVSVGNR